MEGPGGVRFHGLGPEGVPFASMLTVRCRREFDIPAEWTNRRVFLSFEAANSALHVWINGNAVGYSQVRVRSGPRGGPPPARAVGGWTGGLTAVKPEWVLVGGGG